MTACNLCSAAPHVGWFQTVPRPGTTGRENSHGDFLTEVLTDTAQSTGSESRKILGQHTLGQGRSASGSPSGWRHPWQRGGDLGWSRKARGPESAQCITHPPQDAPNTFPPLRTGTTQRAQKTQACQHGADHGIPGAEIPPGSHSPRGRGRGRGGFWLHLLCVPAALPASVLKRSQSERGPKERRRAASAAGWNTTSASAAWQAVGSGGPRASRAPVADRDSHGAAKQWDAEQGSASAGQLVLTLESAPA